MSTTTKFLRFLPRYRGSGAHSLIATVVENADAAVYFIEVENVAALPVVDQQTVIQLAFFLGRETQRKFGVTRSRELERNIIFFQNPQPGDGVEPDFQRYTVLFEELHSSDDPRVGKARKFVHVSVHVKQKTGVDHGLNQARQRLAEQA